MTKKYKVTWKEYLKLIDKLACQIKNSEHYNNITCIYGIPRGGLIPATILSYKLDLPLEMVLDYYMVGIKARDSDEDDLILVVDDILDSGDTIYPYLKAPFLTAVVYNKNIDISPCFEGKCIGKDKWIVMPYDPPIDNISIKTEDYYKKNKK